MSCVIFYPTGKYCVHNTYPHPQDINVNSIFLFYLENTMPSLELIRNQNHAPYKMRGNNSKPYLYKFVTALLH